MNVTTALETLTLAELRPLAAQAGIAGRSRMRKAELIAALAEVPATERRLALSDLPSLRPELVAAEAGTTRDPELRAAEVAEANGEPLPLTRRQAEHLVVIDQQRGDVPEAGFAREDWLAQGRDSMEQRWLDEPGETALSDAYRIVMGLLPATDDAPAPRNERTELIAEGLARGGWARQTAETLQAAIAEGRGSELDSLTARLRRDLNA